MKMTQAWRRRTGLLAVLLLVSAMGAAQGPAGSAWKVIGPGGGGTTIGPTISPHNPHLVVEHCDMSGGYVTHDDGLSWHMFNLRGGMNVFAFDPADANVIYAGNAALWRSGDSGRTWAMVFPNPALKTVEHQLGDHSDYSLTTGDAAYPGGSVTAIAIAEGGRPEGHASAAKRFYLAFWGAGKQATIVTSLGDAANWRRLATLPERVLLLSIHEPDLVAISGASAYRIEADGGVTQLGAIPGGIKAASAGHAGGRLWIYATSLDGKVHLSQDSGQHWSPITPDLHQSAGRFEAIATSEGHPETAYVGFRGVRLGEGNENLFNGIAKTTDAGRTWKIVFRESDRPAANLTGSWIEQRSKQGNDDIWFDPPYSLGASPTDPQIVYATDLFRSYRTLGGGTSWLEVNSKPVEGGGWVSRGLDVTTNYGVQFDPFDSRHIFIDNTDIGLIQSTDGGLSWQSSSEGVPDNWRNTTYWVAFDPAQRGLMWGAFSGTHDLPRPKMWRSRSPESYTGGVGVSTNGGRHWQPSGTGLPQDSVTHILLDPASPVGKRILYACAFGRGVYKTTDGGKTWTQKNAGISGAEPFAWRITASQDGSLYLVVARRTEKMDYSSAGSGALYRSTDKAEHWEKMALPEGVTGPTAVEVDPRDPRRLYLTAWGQEGAEADRNGGVFLSEDGGKSWRPLYTQSQHVYDLTIDPAHPDTLYITGFDAAAWRSTDGGAHWQRLRGFDFKWGHRVILDPDDPAKIFITTFGGGVWLGPAEGDSNEQETVLTPVPVAQ